MFPTMYARDSDFQMQPFSGCRIVCGKYQFGSTSNYQSVPIEFALDTDGNPPFAEVTDDNQIFIMTQIELNTTRGEQGRANVVVIPNTISANGFTMRLLNGDSTAMSPVVHWIAFGKPYEPDVEE